MERFGRYLLAERIAQGGMAEVFRGALLGPQGFSRPLAIKRILPGSTEDQDYVRMFLDEARITASLHHPNIVAVTDLGEHEGRFFLAMEYVEGRHLGQVIMAAIREGQPLPRAFCLYVLRESLHGLNHAHARTDAENRPLGIVHRDVSPQNILVGFDGNVKVADFGIAKAAARATRTDAGVIKGKFAYLAPEQADGARLDARVDLYALGVVAWEMFAVRRMFPSGTEDAAMVKRILAGDLPALAGVVPDLPPAVVRLVDRALARDPAARWQSAEEFAQAAGAELARMAPGFSALNAAAIMKRLFPREVEEERRKVSELEALTRKSTQWLMEAVTAAAPADALTAATVPQQDSGGAPSSLSSSRRRVAPAVLGALVLGAGLAAYWVGRTPAAQAPVEAALAEITVETVPSGAQVFVAAEAVPRGTSPLRVRLPIGSAATLRATLPGRREARREFRVTSARLDVILDLPRAD